MGRLESFEVSRVGADHGQEKVLQMECERAWSGLVGWVKHLAMYYDLGFGCCNMV
jgi:hypothetical protein